MIMIKIRTYYILAAAVIAFLLSCCSAAGQAPERNSPHRRLQAEIEILINEADADVGVAVLYDGEIVCSANSGRTFPLMSVFKLHQVIVVLDSLGRGPLSLDSSVHVTKEMLRPDTYSPLRDAYPDGNISLTVNELLCRSLLQSDNNACDILFSIFGGTERVQAAMHELGLYHTQILWTEDEMHADEARFAENSGTPEDAVRLVEIAYGNAWLRETLTRCATGRNRLPALLPKDIRIGHKTGTWGIMPDGTVNGINDAGFAVLPDGRHYSIAVFCNASRLSFEDTESLIARISLLVCNHIISL